MQTPDHRLHELMQIRHRIVHYQTMIYSTPCIAQRFYYQDLLVMEVDRLLALTAQMQSAPLPYDQASWRGEASRGVKPGCHSGRKPRGDTPRQRPPQHQPECRQQPFTPEELAQYDGSGGRPAYVAVDGIVYDLSLEPTWGGGTHFSLYAGQDLTGQFQGCHPGMEQILTQLPQIGVLVKGEGGVEDDQ